MADREVIYRVIANFRGVRDELKKTREELAKLQAQEDAYNASSIKGTEENIAARKLLTAVIRNNTRAFKDNTREVTQNTAALTANAAAARRAAAARGNLDRVSAGAASGAAERARGGSSASRSPSGAQRRSSTPYQDDLARRVRSSTPVQDDLATRQARPMPGRPKDYTDRISTIRQLTAGVQKAKGEIGGLGKIIEGEIVSETRASRSSRLWDRVLTGLGTRLQGFGRFLQGSGRVLRFFGDEALKAGRKLNQSFGSNIRNVGRNLERGLLSAVRKVGVGWRGLRGIISSGASTITSGFRRAADGAKSFGNSIRGAFAGGGGINNFFRRAASGADDFGKKLQSVKPPQFFKIARFGVMLAIVGLISMINPMIAALGAAGAAGIALASNLASLAGAAAGIGPAIFTIAAAAAALKIAFSGVGDAFKALGAETKDNTENARENARAHEDAAQRVTDAQQAQTDAIAANQRAQESLDDAQRNAIRTLRDLRKEVAGAAADQQAAEADILSAQDNLYSVLADPRSTKAQIAQARAQLAQAKQALQDVKDKNKDNKEDLAKIDQKGGTFKQVPEYEDAVRAADNAKRSVEDSNRDLKRAQQDLLDITTNGTKAQKDAKSALDKLSPSMQKIVKQIYGMNDGWKKSKRNIQEAFAAEVVGNVGKLGPLMQVLERILTPIAKTLGILASRMLSLISSAEWLTDLQTLGGGANRIVGKLGDIILDLLNAFKDISVVALPFLETFVSKLAAGADSFADLVKNARSDGSMVAWFKKVEDRAYKWWDVIKNIGKTIFIVGKIFNEELGDKLLGGGDKGLVGQAKKLLDTLQGEDSKSNKESGLRKYLNDIQPLLAEMGHVLKGFFDWLFGVMADPENIKNAQEIFSLVRTKLGPAVSNFLDVISKSGTGAAFITALAAIVDLLAHIANSHGLEIFFKVLQGAASGINWLFDMPGLAPILGGILSTLALIKAITFVGSGLAWLLGAGVYGNAKKLFGLFSKNKGTIASAATKGSAGVAGTGGMGAAFGSATGAAEVFIGNLRLLATQFGLTGAAKDIFMGNLKLLQAQFLTTLPGGAAKGAVAKGVAGTAAAGAPLAAGGGRAALASGGARVIEGEVVSGASAVARGGRLARLGRAIPGVGGLLAGGGAAAGVGAKLATAGRALTGPLGIVSLLGDLAGSAIQGKNKGNGGARDRGGRTASFASRGALIGGTIGSVIPGLGTAVGAGVGAAAGAGVANFDKIKDFFKNIPGWVSTAYKSTKEWIGNLVSGIGDFFSKGANKVGDFFKGIPGLLTSGIDSVNAFFGNLVDGALNFVKGAGENLMKFIRNIPYLIGYVGKNVWNGLVSIKGWVKTQAKELWAFVKSIPHLFAEFGTNLWSNIKGIGSWIAVQWTSLMDWFKALPGRVAALSVNVWDGMKAIGGWFVVQYNAVGDWFTVTLPALMTSLGTNIWAFVKGIGPWFEEQYARVSNWFTKTLPALMTSLGTNIWAFVKGIGPWFEEQYAKVSTWFTVTLPNAVKNFGAGLWENLGGIDDWLAAQWGKFTGWLTSIGQWFKDHNPFSGFSDEVKRGVSDADAGRKPQFRNAGGSIAGSGSSDTVPAMLTPGEYVIKKSSARALGPAALSTLNKWGDGAKRFAKGGAVKALTNALIQTTLPKPAAPVAGVQHFASGGSVGNLMRGGGLGFGRPDLSAIMAQTAGNAITSNNNTSVNNGITIEKVEINNPKPERASSSLPRSIRNISRPGGSGRR